MKKAMAFVCAVAATLSAMPAEAQPYPNKSIRLVVPYAAGGAADITARIVGQKMSQAMGVPVLVDNRGGANGNIGTDMVAKAAPDGYTVLLVASGPIVVNQALYARLPYDPLKDLLPVTELTRYQFALVVPAASPITGLPDLLRRAKAAPGTLSYGSTGIGGGGHLAGEMLARVSGTELTHVPYKGSAPALADLLGGQLSFTFDTVVTAAPQIGSGKLRGFAVSGPYRASSLPEVPTMAELGFKDFNVTQFQGLLVPAGTDAAIVERLRAEAVKALRAPDVVKRLVHDGGYEMVGSSPAEFSRLIHAEAASYGKLIQQAHIKAE